MPPALQLHDVSVWFRATNLRHQTLKQTLAHLFDRQRPTRVTALDKVSLSIADGESVGIIGRNGAGKSTLLRVLAQIIIPNQGRLVLHRRVVPLLELGVGFHPEMTGRENCYLVGSLLGFSPAETTRRLPGIIEFAELGEYMDTPLKHYSSGMHARLAFSLITEVEPEVLLLDEILSVGDEFFKRKSKQRLQDLMRRGVATVMVSHSLSYLLSHCDRLVWLSHGKVVADGVAADVARDYLAQMGNTGATEPVGVREAGQPDATDVRSRSAIAPVV
jgi:ABC-type polysaccharide/polyol phosphate transport system ATPase subunit